MITSNFFKRENVFTMVDRAGKNKSILLDMNSLNLVVLLDQVP